ncbi:hypothetical protein ACFXTN_030375 [Malus domestica]|uniref:Uncharacterized protein n=1 Tax=Malus domestica TaxID=3750 RepID=A0A498K781_MALDO|nr:hypothetical protein DVH24_015104 [Malus domestica]
MAWGFAEEEGQSCYNSGHLKTDVLDSDLSMNMKNKRRGRDCYLQIIVTQSKVTGNPLKTDGFAGKTGVLNPTRSKRKGSSKLCSVPSNSQGRGPGLVASLLDGDTVLMSRGRE